MGEQHIIHRGQWEGQSLPNSFESFKLYKTSLEGDVMLLNDGKTLAVAHPGDFTATDKSFEAMSPTDFGKLKVKKGEQQGGAAPFFTEYLAGCYDRGISATFEIKGSTPEMTAKAARRTVETIKEMQTEGSFKVQGKEDSKFLEEIGIHSFSPDAIVEARRTLAETGLSLRIGFTWLSSYEHAKNNSIAALALRYYEQGKNWEQAGIKAAKELGCNFVFFVEPNKMTAALVQAAHVAGLELYMYIRPNENTPELRNALLQLKVDKLLY